MSSYARKVKKSSRSKRSNKRSFRYRRTSYRRLARRVSAISRKLAAEVCKFETTPDNYTNILANITQNGSTLSISSTVQTPLTSIVSGTPWIMPLNWIYQATRLDPSSPVSYWYDGAESSALQTLTLSVRNPVWYNTYASSTLSDPNNDAYVEGIRSPGFQYRLKYIYLRGLFNASVTESVNNSDGAVRIVVVKDKQATGGAATWYDENYATNSRGVFNAQRIDAQLNPNTLGRFKIMYDKTLRFNTINGYKPFKYFKRLSSVVKNNRDVVTVANGLQQGNFYETNSRAPPVQKNAYYLMIFSDGLNFTYSNDSSTPAASFHIFNRVSYYDN